MNRSDVLHRLTGVALLCGAGGSASLHRQVWLAHATGPASVLEAGLGLTTFVLACMGLLLLLSGARLRDGWRRDCDRAKHRRQRTRQAQEGVGALEAEQRRIVQAAAVA